jgi:methylthioribose-1-phosphate isomerase
VTPARLITYLVGFEDLYTPETFRRKYRVTASGDSDAKAKVSGKYLLIYGIPPTSQYSFLRSALQAEQAERVLVPEMRPQLWGAVMARALLEHGAPVTLISDNIMGTLFAQGEIRKLCLFYESLTETGPKGLCGSLLTVQLARLHGVPIELFSGEERSDSTADQDVSTFMGKRICPAGVAVRPVEAEVVPWALFKG